MGHEMKPQATQPNTEFVGHSPSEIAARTRLPESGRWMIRHWALIHDCTVETIRNSIEKHKVRTLKCGGTMIIKAEWWWQAMEQEGSETT